MGQPSAIGVLDKAVLVLTAAARAPVTLAQLVEDLALPRATVHRIAVALEAHRLLARTTAGAWVPGPGLSELTVGSIPPLAVRAGPVLERLCQQTGESAQLFIRQGAERACVAVADRPSGLRDTVPLGARLSMSAGSAAHVLLAWSDPDDQAELLLGAAFDTATLERVRRRGYAHSAGEREPGVASASVPVRDDPAGPVLAAVSVSGPIERVGARPGRLLIDALIAASTALSAT